MRSFDFMINPNHVYHNKQPTVAHPNNNYYVLYALKNIGGS